MKMWAECIKLILIAKSSILLYHVIYKYIQSSIHVAYMFWLWSSNNFL